MQQPNLLPIGFMFLILSLNDEELFEFFNVAKSEDDSNCMKILKKLQVTDKSTKKIII